MFKKETILFIVLAGFFVCNALMAEFIGVKIFSLEATLGLSPANWKLFGENYSFNLTAGVILWPAVFVMTDIINEYFGKKGVRFLSWLAVVLIAYAYLMVYLVVQVEPAQFWLNIHSDIQPDINMAFGRIFGQGMGIIVASLIAFLVGQLVDVIVFQKLRKVTGAKFLWARATGSTLVSQLIDSFIVLFVAFYLWPVKGLQWPIGQIVAVGIVNYTYKVIIATLLTPLLYIIHWVIDTFLGKEAAARLMAQAAGEEPS
ncbi:MAG: queuosine precursor transporter [Bacteroidia bacterium]|nr:queuosine precursor transporter [Bacteroidia bacterium]